MLKLKTILMASCAALAVAATAGTAAAQDPFLGETTSTYSSSVGLQINLTPNIPLVTNGSTQGFGWAATINPGTTSYSNLVSIMNIFGLTLTGNMSLVTGQNDIISLNCTTTYTNITAGPVTNSGACQDGLYLGTGNTGITFNSVRAHITHIENNSADTVLLMKGVEQNFTNNAGTVENLRWYDVPDSRATPGGGTVQNEWSMFSPNPNVQLQHAGPAAFGGNTQPVTVSLNGLNFTPPAQVYFDVAGPGEGSHSTNSTTSSGATSIAFPSSGMAVNMVSIGNTGIPNGAAITGINSTAQTIALSQATTAAISSGVTLNFFSEASLCPAGGQGLVINGFAVQTPSTCAWLSPNGLTSSTLYYVYAGTTTMTVSNAAADPSGNGQVYLTVNSTGALATGDSCIVSGVTGTTEANGTFVATDVDGAHVSLQGTTFVNAYSSGGSVVCPVTLTASTTGHTTASNGVEVESGNPALTLVGMVYTSLTGSASFFLNNTTRCLVASWYNRNQRKCIGTFTADRTTTSTTYAEFNSEDRPKFLSWGAPGQLVNGIATQQAGIADSPVWRVSGAANNGTGADGCALSIGFDSTTANETEQVEFMQGTAGADNAVSLEGRKAGLAEGEHYITLLGKAITGGTCTVRSAYTSIQVDTGG